MGLCDAAGPSDFQDPCVRASWGSLLPFTLVFVLCLVALPLPESGRRITAYLKAPFRRFLTLEEAEALDACASNDGAVEPSTEEKVVAPLMRTVVLVFVGLAETLCWLSFGSYNLITNAEWAWAEIFPFLMSFSWLYTVLRPIVRPVVTVPLDLFYVYSLLLPAAILQLGGVIYDHVILDMPLPPTLVVVASSVNLVAIIGLLGVVLAIPFAIPSQMVKKEDIGYSVIPEDYTSLWGWMTFSWVYPLIRRGRSTTLNEEDVWNLSITMQSRPVFLRFKEFRQSSLVRRFLVSNIFDFLVDLGLTIVSVMFNYTGPFFLKQILDAVDTPNPTAESRAKAYIYAFLAFVCSLGKAQADVQHLWFGRRITTRMRSELMASIYDKALKRKDFSGIVDKNKVNEKQDEEPSAQMKKQKKDKKREGKEKEDTADDPKAGADVGKIVNLMAGDANRVAQTTSSLYFIYGAPFEFIIAGTYLYQLLGWSAFAGFFVLIAGWPLNSWVAKRSIRIQKGSMAARDKRMAVLTELIGSVKFIKFFAWEDKWIQRTLDAREVEMKWMSEARINSALFYLLWTLAPILVSIISFFVYVIQGNQLTISVAFTSIALFNMIRYTRLPLNIVPTWIVQILQTGVAVKRISVYLGEDEVTEQVSSLKRDSKQVNTLTDEDGLGLENASFKWNEVEEKEDPNKKDKLTRHSQSASSSSDDNVTIEVDDGSTAVDPFMEVQDHRFELRDVNIRFPDGQLTLVTGPTASGKTALLMAVLGEMTTISGRIIMSKDTSKVDENGLTHSISYGAQMPWLRHQSIKDNILFDSPFDEERYNAVIECCALRPDLDMLEDGDATEIGARGVSLSGGQKARVALARAVYTRTKYVLLDDPLSAVDSHTSRFLFEKLLCGPLLANRTVVLVTHHVDLVLPGAYYLVRMLDGRIDTQGTIKDLRAQGILEGITSDESVEAKAQEIAAEDEAEVEAVEGDKKADGVAKKPRKLISEEHREAGGVKWSIYKSYLKASSYWIWVLLASIVVLSQMLGVTEKVWIKIWGEAYGQGHTNSFVNLRTFATPEHEVPLHGHVTYHYQDNHQSLLHRIKGTFGIDWPDALQHPLFYVGVYAAIGFINALTSVSSVIAQYTGALRASRILFKQLLITVIRATFRFHDTTPQGRMLNRFGKDIETIDTSLAGSLQAVNSSLASFFAAVLTVAFVFPWFLIPALIIGFGYYELAIGYLNTGRDLRRMESNTRSPIFSDFSELLEGIVTVRAFSAETRFLDRLHQKIDVTTKMWYNFWMTNRWLLLNFDGLGALAVLITSLFSIATLTASAGLAGLCITSAMAFTGSVYWACRFWTALELDLNSVERVVEYLDLPQEPPTVIESNRVPAYWPSTSNGNALVSVENLSIKYASDLPSVLQDVSFTLKAGERVGLLGRTGSGKSTLAMSILRFVDPASGRIVIDGIDISKIGLHDLRSRITFIPQDATLFSGTLRDNLDPFGEHEDSDCLDVLYRVQMINHSAMTSRQASAAPSRTSSRPASILGSDSRGSPDTNSMTTTATDSEIKTKITLDTQVSAGGTNFSQGQRQLIAMARALLRRSSIIVLDEATSSIDFATDAKIQATIREQFTDSLLLTVAHRLRTVIDYDRLIVLDKGRIVEFDTPWNLIQKEDGVFRSMCLKSGSFGELEATARAKAEGPSKLI
ncbi:hypothetical protein AMATHDRAFT_158119 [Amanita thiersii Skay4041]|uniref:Multidrug resistance-associated ABC transporter n=1 Tax=Amanita thiersii Skay4041 TaxID=703135 RepID=A0A2A9NDK4_9AGAR|nr:hypothetical protein AMATHDRAFT_158119 [Amanita thiersii Skay4041]